MVTWDGCTIIKILLFSFNYYFMTLKGFFKTKLLSNRWTVSFLKRSFLGLWVIYIIEQGIGSFCKRMPFIYLSKSSESKLNDVLKVLLAGGITNVRQCVIGPVKTVNPQQLEEVWFLLHGRPLEAERAIWLLTLSDKLDSELKEKRAPRGSNDLGTHPSLWGICTHTHMCCSRGSFGL